MDALDYPLPREKRQSPVSVGDGGTSYGPFTFKIFDEVDVKAFVRLDGEELYAPVDFAVTKTSGLAYDTFSIELDEAITADDELIVLSQRLHERLISVTRGGAISAAQLEKELSKQGTVIQELRRDLDRTLKMDHGIADPKNLPAPEAGKVLIGNADGDGYVNKDAAQFDLLLTGTVGRAVVASETVAQAIGALGGGTIGAAVFASETEATAQAALGGTTVGRAVFAAANAGAALDALGGSTIGKAVFSAANRNLAATALELGNMIVFYDVSQEDGKPGFTLAPTITATNGLGILGAFQIVQADPTLLTSDTFINGILINMWAGNGPGNQNAGIIAFMNSKAGADPFGGDFHACIPEDATAAPAYAIGTQASVELNSATYVASVASYALVATVETTHAKKATAVIALGTSTGGGSNFLLTMFNKNVFTDEGFVLIPANDSNPSFRAYAITDTANSQNNWTVRKDGGGFYRGKLGVGIEAPIDKMHLHTSLSENLFVRFTNSGTGTASSDGMLLGIDPLGNGYLWNKEAASIYLMTNNAVAMQIGGNLGITVGTGGGLSDHGIGTIDVLNAYYANGTKVVGTQQPVIAKLTDSTGGSAGSTLSAVSGSGADATINANFARLNTKINAIIDSDRAHGLNAAA